MNAMLIASMPTAAVVLPMTRTPKTYAAWFLRALAWLFRIAHNVVVNHYRARRQFVPLDDDISTDDSSLDRVEHAADGQLLATLISELPDDQRNLLSLVVDAGLTSQQIGDLIGKNAGAVRVQLHRILKSLRERFLGECVQ